MEVRELANSQAQKITSAPCAKLIRVRLRVESEPVAADTAAAKAEDADDTIIKRSEALKQCTRHV